MLDSGVRILDFDSSVCIQDKLIYKYAPEVINLKDLASHARLYMSAKTSANISQRIKGSPKNRITFIGSGDFHHISSNLINQFNESFSVVVFDFHPDWDIFPPRKGCGSWVSEILKNKNIKKIVLIGVSSNDISTLNIQSANLSSLNNDRVEIYPYQHAPSHVYFRKVPENNSLDVKKGLLRSRISWQEIKNKKIDEFILKIIKRLPTKQVYVSLDKDCLRRDFALTNWEEGLLSLDELILSLKLIKSNLDIIGMDITGEYSKVLIQSKLKGLISRLDHPKEIRNFKIPEIQINQINETTNLKILQAIL